MKNDKGSFDFTDLFSLIGVYIMFYAFFSIWNPFTAAIPFPDNTPYISLINLAFALLPALVVYMWLASYIKKVRGQQ